MFSIVFVQHQRKQNRFQQLGNIKPKSTFAIQFEKCHGRRVRSYVTFFCFYFIFIYYLVSSTFSMLKYALILARDRAWNSNFWWTLIYLLINPVLIISWEVSISTFHMFKVSISKPLTQDFAQLLYWTVRFLDKHRFSLHYRWYFVQTTMSIY